MKTHFKKFHSSYIQIFFILVSVSFSYGQEYKDYSYFGIGYSKISIESSSPTIDGRNSDGVMILWGNSFLETWSFEIMGSIFHDIEVGPTQDIYYPAATAEYLGVAAGLRKNLWSLDKRRLSPWLTAGGGYDSISWDTFLYSMSGFSYYYGLGLDLKIAQPFLMRLQYISKHFSASDDYSNHPSYSTKVSDLSANLVFRW